MKIETEKMLWNKYDGTMWVAIDRDSYDGLGSPVGWASTKMAAINDLVEQIVEELENRLDDKIFENQCIRAENQALLTRCLANPPETSRTDDAGDLQIQKEYQDQAPESGGQESAPSELPPRFMGRSMDVHPQDQE